MADLRAFDRLPRQVSLAELRANPGTEKNEAAEKCAGAGFANHRSGVPGNPAHGWNCGVAGDSAALKICVRGALPARRESRASLAQSAPNACLSWTLACADQPLPMLR